MIKKKDLESLESLYKEQEDLEKRIKKLESIPQRIVTDSVTKSSKHFPYIEQHTVITGYENDKIYHRRKNRIKKLKKLLEKNKEEVVKRITNIEYELNRIEDSDIRKIIRFKYEDNKNWIQIMYLMKYSSESTARMKLERFFEKK